MCADAPDTALDALVARLAGMDDADARLRVLQDAVRAHGLQEVAERLKSEADTTRYRDAARSRRWCRDLIALGYACDAPGTVALGRMGEAAIAREQGRYRESLALFDEAGALCRAHGDETGWARVQIGRIQTCMALARFDEALQTACAARAILERAGDRVRVASIDNNLALLLDRMNRPAEALAYSERALDTYRTAGSRYYFLHTLGNHALLLWRLGRVREALTAYGTVREGYAALGAAADAARVSGTIGAAYLALGRYADAASTLSGAREALASHDLPYLAALAGVYLVECFVRMGRFHEAVALAGSVREELTAHEAAVDQVQLLLWQAHGYAGLGSSVDALRVLDEAARLVAERHELSAYQAPLDVLRAQMLWQSGRTSEACTLLQQAIPALDAAGLAVDGAAARLLQARVLLDGGRPDDARPLVGAILRAVEAEGLDWLKARALHLDGRIEMSRGQRERAGQRFAAAIRCLDRVQRHVAWDDRSAFAGTTIEIFEDAVSLALQARQPDLALYYADRAKARALADHVQARIDVRPRVRDERSRVLVDELAALRERYAWLTASRHDPTAAAPPAAPVRRASAGHDATLRDDVVAIERRIAGIWRELQEANPAYRDDAAALAIAAGDDDASGDGAAAWDLVARARAVLGDDAALLEYGAAGDDLLLFVLRAGAVQAVRLEGARAAAQRLVSLLRLNVERSAAAAGQHGPALRALSANAQGLLRRLYDLLLAPAAPYLDGCARLVAVPHGVTHHVPFHALHDGRRYLIESVDVSYAPCAGLLEHFEGRYRAIQEGERRRDRMALVLACSDQGALPHVEAEGRAVAAILGGRVLEGEAATLGALRAHAGACAVLHLAAHATFRPDEPLFSSLQLADGRLSTLDVFDLDLRCSLVTLSACETALGVSGAGDELMGLSRAFLYAGAPSLVLSLWKVEDRSASIVMDTFYRLLAAGLGKAAALRQAQLNLLYSDLNAPFFWAPFQLIGHAGPL